jgi:hypothetical protein
MSSDCFVAPHSLESDRTEPSELLAAKIAIIWRVGKTVWATRGLFHGSPSRNLFTAQPQAPAIRLRGLLSRQIGFKGSHNFG